MTARERSTGRFGDVLRHWRTVRRFSQMDLALAANVSPRHLSFIETGRSQPGYNLVVRIADVLDLPLRHTNSMLLAAGYAPRYTTWSLDDDQSGTVRAALERMLVQHEPYPAFAPAGLRPYVADFELVQDLLLKRLREESIRYQSEALFQLYEACEADVAHLNRTGDAVADQQLPVVALGLRKGDIELRFFSTVTTFGTAVDVTTEELRIESLFPADGETETIMQRLSR